MTLQELIIGHYEGTLTPAEQASLDKTLAESPEARILFEQHGEIDDEMRKEAALLVPSAALSEATMTTALTTGVGGAVGSGLGGWLSAKVAVGLSSLLVGGLVVGIVLTQGDENNDVLPTAIPTTQEQILEPQNEVVGDAPEVTIETPDVPVQDAESVPVESPRTSREVSRQSQPRAERVESSAPTTADRGQEEEGSASEVTPEEDQPPLLLNSGGKVNMGETEKVTVENESKEESTDEKNPE